MTAFPKLDPRPFDKYPSGWSVAMSTAMYMVRAPLFCTLFLLFCALPLYTWLCDEYGRQGYTDERIFFTALFVAVKATAWVMNHSFFYLLERYALLENYKIDRRPVQIPTASLVRDRFCSAHHHRRTDHNRHYLAQSSVAGLCVICVSGAPPPPDIAAC
jgi:hypothetical protein